VAAKTGTTQDGADGWFLMMHPHLVTGAWVGFNDRRLSFRTDYWEAGSHNALRLAGDFFQRVLKAHPEWTDRRFARPAGYAPPAPPDLRRTSAPAAPDTTDPLIRRALDPEAALRSQRAVPPSDRSAGPTDALSRRSADPEAALRDAIAVPSDSADADASERNSP
jgi:penicillin-binding protein 1A